MKIVYLPSTVQDFVWFKQYYISVFSEGNANAKKQFLAIEKLLKSNPFIGYSVEGYKDVRELQITRTPFSLIYRVKNNRIEVLRLWDNRQGGTI